MRRKRVYVDMDGVLCDYWKRFYELQNGYIKLPQTTYGFYTSLEPIEGAIESFKWLEEHFDTWILTRPSYQNPLCYTEKRVWVEENLGIKAAQRLIICWNKGLLKGDYLIDDTLIDAKLIAELREDDPEFELQIPFEGEFMHFGTDYNWKSAKQHLTKQL